MSRAFHFGVSWDSESKGNREKSGFHPKTEEEMAGLVIGKLCVFGGFETHE